MRPVTEGLPDPLPWGTCLRVALAAANHLSAIRRLVAIGPRDSGTVDQLLGEAQRFGALALSLTERVQADLPFARIERRLLQGEP
jgi:hypothetical protein